MAGRLKGGHDNMRKARRGYVYILASGKKGTLYIGVTNNLSARVFAPQARHCFSFHQTVQRE